MNTKRYKLHHHDYSFIFKYVLMKSSVNPLNPELNPICYSLALLAHHFLHVSRIRVNIFRSRFIEWNSVYFLKTGSATTQQAKLLTDVLRCWTIQISYIYTPSPCFTPICFNAPCQFTFFNLYFLIFGLTHLSWFTCTYLSLAFLLREHHFYLRLLIFKPTISGRN